VPVIGDGRENRVDIRACEEFLELMVLGAALERPGLAVGSVLLLDLLFGVFAFDRIDVADGDDLNLFVVKEAGQV